MPQHRLLSVLRRRVLLEPDAHAPNDDEPGYARRFMLTPQVSRISLAILRAFYGRSAHMCRGFSRFR
jgi:hypothetical protein